MKAYVVLESNSKGVEKVRLFREEPTAVAYAHEKMADKDLVQQEASGEDWIEAWGRDGYSVVVMSCDVVDEEATPPASTVS